MPMETQQTKTKKKKKDEVTVIICCVIGVLIFVIGFFTVLATVKSDEIPIIENEVNSDLAEIEQIEAGGISSEFIFSQRHSIEDDLYYRVGEQLKTGKRFIIIYNDNSIAIYDLEEVPANIEEKVGDAIEEIP